MVAIKFLFPALLFLSSGVAAAPLSARYDELAPYKGPGAHPGAHSKVVASSIWDKRTDSIEARQVDLSGLSNPNQGSAEVKTKASSVWWKWWTKRTESLEARQFDGPSNPNMGSAEVKTKASSVWWKWWTKRTESLEARQIDGPSNPNMGSAATKIKADSVWDWFLGEKRNVDDRMHRREASSIARRQLSAQVKTNQASVWNLWSWF